MKATLTPATEVKGADKRTPASFEHKPLLSSALWRLKRAKPRRKGSTWPIQVDHVSVDKAMANHLLSHCKMDLQRKPKRATINSYANQMRLGIWRVSTIRLGVLGGEMYLIDGLQRLSAVLAEGLAQPFLLETHYFADMDEMRHYMFHVVDNNAVRTHRDVDHMSGLADELGLSNIELRMLGGAVVLLADGMLRAQSNATQKLPSHMVALMKRDWAPYLKAWHSQIMPDLASMDREQRLLREQLYKRCCNSLVAAIGMLTMRCAPDVYGPIWKDLINKFGGINDKHPLSLLREMLRKTKFSTTHYGNHARRICGALNALVLGKNGMSHIRGIDVEKPLKLLHTPFKGQNMKVCYTPIPASAEEELYYRHRQQDAVLYRADSDWSKWRD